MNLFEKLSAIENELSAVAKNLMVGEGKNQYKAVGEADVLAAVKPLEYKYRVYSYPYSREIIDNDMITTTKTYKEQTSEVTKFFMRVKTVYRFVDVDKPGDFIDITTYGDGIDSGDKAPGKAMTYGDKYALLKAYKIITGDDPDQTASDEGRMQRGVQYAKKNEPLVTPEQRKMMIAKAQRVYGDKTIGNGKLVEMIRAEGYNDANIPVTVFNRIMGELDTVVMESAEAKEVEAELAGKSTEDVIGQMGLPFK